MCTLLQILCSVGILSIIKKPSFFIHLIILEDVLQIINVLNTKLQNKGATLGSAVNLIEGIINTFESLRAETEFQKIWNKIIDFAEYNNLDLLVTGKYFILYIKYTHVCFIYI